MERGSEWHKWDLHIHTPGTAKNDQFRSNEDIWLEYIQRLEDSDVAVFGITDYFSIENYLKVKTFQANGRLEGKCILPNVELRITPVTGKNKPVNIHVIFDPSFTEEDLTREFFREIKFEYKNESFSCVSNDLIKFGRKLTSDDTLQEHAAIKKAIEKFHISFEDLRTLLRKEFFKNRIVVALSNSSNDGISGLLAQEGGLDATKKEICRMSNVILSGNPKDVDYFLGRNTSVEEVINSCGSLMPCITGSDAHSLEQIGLIPNDRITWIKATPTFEGLRQILFEPEERVVISELKPDVKYDYNVIDYIDLNTTGTWHQKVYFNQNLNTIIGGRSTGKSTLLASIATKLNVSNVEKSDYIRQLCENVRVVWRDGQDEGEKNIEYFPQNYLSNIENGQYTDLLLKILLNNQKKKDRYEGYKAKISEKYHEIQSKVTQLFEKRRLFIEKRELFKNMGDLEGVKLEIAKLQKERNEIQARLTDKKEILDAFEKTESRLMILREKKQLGERETLCLKQMFAQPLIINNDEISLSGLSKETSDWLSIVIKGYVDNANTHIHTDIQQKITELQKTQLEIIDEINRIQSTNEYKQGQQIFNENMNLATIVRSLESLNTKLSDMIILQDKIKALESESLKIRLDLVDLHTSYLDIMNDIASEMYMQHDGIKLQASIILKDSFKTTLEDCLSLRQYAATDLINNLLEKYSRRLKTEIKDCTDEMINRAIREEISFKNGYDTNTFVSKILSGCWYDLSFDVEYDGDNLKDMSPGKRSFVILKLLLDFNDKDCPILIDQPEDNLDNRAIYNELVKYIRKKKKERQIILVTHNPNIVVGADSEEIIVANQHGTNSPNKDGIKFQYVSGALEDSGLRKKDEKLPILFRCGIREHVCDILEGGEEAFKSRENKYGF